MILAPPPDSGASLSFRLSGPIAILARRLILLASLLVITGLLVLPFFSWLLWLGIGAFLSAWNFWGLAYSIQRFFAPTARFPHLTKKNLLIQLFGTNLRLFITGIMLYISLVYFAANVFALAAGLSLTVFMIPASLLISKKSI